MQGSESLGILPFNVRSVVEENEEGGGIIRIGS